MRAVGTATGDRDALIVAHVGLAASIARRAAPGTTATGRDDLTQAAMIGLIEAVDRFDAARGVKFASYTQHRIRGAIRDALRAADWVPRRVRASGAPATRVVSLDASGDDPTGTDPTDSVIDRVDVRRAVERLPPLDRAVIVALFWGDWSQAGTAASVGVSAPHVSRVRRRALARLRAALA